jgi:hypothetical protein
MLESRSSRWCSPLWLCVTACLVVASVVSQVRADDPPGGWRLWPGHHSLHPPCMMCPDDYCPKPMPCSAPFKYCGPDDYCCKTMPCVAPFKYCGPNDYCCKPLPPILPLCPTPLYTCGPPPECPCGNGGHDAKVATNQPPSDGRAPPPVH